jgi:sugar lactone lactonase YvrE
MHVHHRLFAIFAIALAPGATGCAASSSRSSNPREATGTASIALTQVPTGVVCIEIDVSGGIFVTQRFTVKSGQSSVLTMSGLPIGNVDVTGAAFNTPCGDVGAPATWVTQSTPATIPDGTSGNVQLEFFPAGTAGIGVDFNGTTFRTVTTFAGTAGVIGNADGIGHAASFTRPEQLAFGNGNLYVADARSSIVRSINVSTATVTTIAGAAGVSGSANGPVASARFITPIGVAYDGPTNAVYVTDNGDFTIRKIDLTMNTVSAFAGTSGTAGSTDGVGAAALFTSPYGITADGSGNLFVTDNGTIRKIVISSGTVSTLAGVPGVTGSTDGTGSKARFESPAGIATDGANLYVADILAIRQVVISTGQVFTIAGDPSNPGAEDGFGGRFQTAEGVAVDPVSQTLFITDFVNSNVRELSLATGLVTTAAGSAQVYGSLDGTGLGAQFHFPIGVALDGAGNVFVADAANATIRKM